MDPQQVMLFPPRGALRVTANGATLADSAIVTWWEGGMFDDMFAHVRTLGQEARP
jgi:hypothetical protein